MDETTNEQAQTTELDAALETLITAAAQYADAIRELGYLPKSHTGKLQQVAALVDNWRTDYDRRRDESNGSL